MSDTLRPEDEAQLLELMAWAAGEGSPIEIIGHASKAALGHPCRAKSRLQMDAFSGVSLYEPEELVLTAGAGTPLAQVQALLDEHNQELAFEPPNLCRLLGRDLEDGFGTLGGLIACNLAGPRRIKAGAARDHFLGFKAVSGRGEAFKSGGRVVKNVSGYDLSKLMAGSWGTLGVMHEVTFKVLPRAEKSRTVLLMGADAETGTRAMTAALNSPYEVSAAAWLPRDLAVRSEVDILKLAKGDVTAVRVEGPAPSTAYRCKMLRKLLGEYGKVEELHSKNTETYWRELRDVLPFTHDDDDRVVWKISTAPTKGAELLDRLSNLKQVEGYLDWGGGLVWLAVDAPNVGAEGLVRDAVAEVGGHATLIRGSEELRRGVPVFQPQTAGVAALAKRLRDQFDPHGILNPGRIDGA